MDNIIKDLIKLGIFIDDDSDIKAYIFAHQECITALKSLDLKNIEPMFHLDIIDENYLRDDNPISMDREAMLSNAINSYNNYVVIDGGQEDE